MSKRGRDAGNRVFIIAFLGTLLLLSAGAAAIIYLPNLQTLHIPISYSVTQPDWFRFISPSPDKLTMIDFAEVYKTTGDTNMFSSTKLLELLGLSSEITVDNSKFSVSVFYPNPNPNQDELALNILRPSEAAYTGLQTELEQKISEKTSYREVFIYSVTRSVNGTYYYGGYVCSIDGYILYSDGSKGLDLITGALDNDSSGKTIAIEPSVKASLYVLNPQSELGFSFSRLPYTVSGVITTSTKLTFEGEKLVTRKLFGFNTTSSAEASLASIKMANLSATDFQMIDNYILVTAKNDISGILGELRTL